MVGTRGRPVCDAMALARRRDRRTGRSMALLMQRAAIAGNRLSTGSWGSVLARFDLAVPVIIALVAFVAARRSLSEPGLFGRDAVAPGWRGFRPRTSAGR